MTYRNIEILRPNNGFAVDGEKFPILTMYYCVPLAQDTNFLIATIQMEKNKCL